MTASELDVRDVPKPQRHPLIFKRFADLGVGESFVLVNGHDPKHLREEFERDQPGAFDWQYEQRDHRLYRIRITRVADAPAPRVLCDVPAVLAGDAAADAAGAVWNLPVADRQLDANVIRLTPGGGVDEHVGPDLDVLMYVLAGSGQLATQRAPVQIAAGSLIWLPRRSRRAIHAGPDGLAYLTVHPRRPALSIGSGPP
ncbi:MAG TPA: DUF2249 domain-containing protein [Jatrophihabitantaceae bacterium]